MLTWVRITKYVHSCVRLEHEGGTLVIDPGVWSEPEALAGADAVLVTHEHNDHVDLLRLKGLDVPVYAPKSARLPGLDFNGVVAGEEFTAAGFRVTPGADGTRASTAIARTARTWATSWTTASTTPGTPSTCPTGRWRPCWSPFRGRG